MSKYPGIVDTKVGYTGGTTSHPSYGQVCSGQTKHAEAVQLTFDPEKTSYTKLLVHFLEEHNPTRSSGSDSESQYRTAVFYVSEDQKQLVAQAISQYEKISGKKVYVHVQYAPEFWAAEEYHQKYYTKHGLGACKLF